MQGLNVTVDIYERVQAGDDTVGGAVRSDGLRYGAIPARIANDRVNAEFRAQGEELPRTVRIILWPDTPVNVRAGDIVIPAAGAWAGQRLRVTGVQRSSVLPGLPRSHIQLTAIHTDWADREE
jgi:hypothetical protein